MARGRRVQLINVSVLPGCWSEGCSFTRLRCVAQSQLQTRPGRGNKFPGPGGRGEGGLDQTGASNPDTGIRSAGQGQDETLKYHQ